MNTRTFCDQLSLSLRRKILHWENTQDDSHGIAQSVAVALRELEGAVRDAAASPEVARGCPRCGHKDK